MAKLAGQLVEALDGLLGIPVPLRVQAWDGSVAGPPGAPTVVLRNRRGLRRLLWQPDELGLARAYVAGDLELAPGTDDQPATGVLGDIVLCPPVAARQGADAGHSTLDELCLLTTHGILHCLGFDHATAEEEAEMFGIQRTILEEFLGRPAPVETRH